MSSRMLLSKSGLIDHKSQLSILQSTEYKKILGERKDEFFKNYGKKKSEKKVSLDDFLILKTIGTGAFGRVVLAKQTSTESWFAIKLMKKKHVVQTKQVNHVLTEKNVLEAMNFPFFVNCKYAFQNNSYLCFVMPYINGGEMFTYLKRHNKFDEELSKFYAAQVLLALEYLHFLNFVYRDLKPENILIEDSGYLKIIDFGFVRLLSSGRAWTFCGTPEYIAPEIIMQKGYGHAVDWWSFGILLYEMNAGFAPFYHSDPMKLYEKILSCSPKYPQTFSFDLKDIIKHLLEVDLTRRFGNLKNGANDVKRHKWFGHINFMDVYNRKMKPPFKPTIKGPFDSSNYDSYDEELLVVSEKDNYSEYFKDF